jgi:hypothetical protein
MICKTERTCKPDVGAAVATFWSRGVDVPREPDLPDIAFAHSSQFFSTCPVMNDHDTSYSGLPISMLPSDSNDGIAFISTSDGMNNVVASIIQSNSLEHLTRKHYPGSSGDNALDPNDATAVFADVIAGSLVFSITGAIDNPPTINTDEVEANSFTLGGFLFVAKDIDGHDPHAILPATRDTSPMGISIVHAIFVARGVPRSHPLPLTDVAFTQELHHGTSCILKTPSLSHFAMLMLYRPIDRGRPTPMLRSRSSVGATPPERRLRSSDAFLYFDHCVASTEENTGWVYYNVMFQCASNHLPIFVSAECLKPAMATLAALPNLWRMLLVSPSRTPDYLLPAFLSPLQHPYNSVALEPRTFGGKQGACASDCTTSTPRMHGIPPKVSQMRLQTFYPTFTTVLQQINIGNIAIVDCLVNPSVAIVTGFDVEDIAGGDLKVDFAILQSNNNSAGSDFVARRYHTVAFMSLMASTTDCCVATFRLQMSPMTFSKRTGDAAEPQLYKMTPFPTLTDTQLLLHDEAAVAIAFPSHDDAHHSCTTDTAHHFVALTKSYHRKHSRFDSLRTNGISSRLLLSMLLRHQPIDRGRLVLRSSTRLCHIHQNITTTFCRMAPAHCSYTSCTPFSHCLLTRTMGEYLGAFDARVPGTGLSTDSTIPVSITSSETKCSADSAETRFICAHGMTCNTSLLGGSIVCSACGFLSGPEQVFVMQEENTLIDASTRLHFSSVLTRFQPMDCGQHMVEQVSDHSADCTFASICPSHSTWMDAGISGSCVATTDDDNDYCAGDFDNGNLLCGHPCVVECNPFSDYEHVEDAIASSRKDNSSIDNLNWSCTTNAYQECRNHMDTGFCLRRRESPCRDCDAQDQRHRARHEFLTSGDSNAFLGDVFNAILLTGMHGVSACCSISMDSRDLNLGF